MKLLLFLFLSLAAAAEKPQKDHYLVKVNEQPTGVYSEVAEASAKDKSLTVRQDWGLPGATPADMKVKAVALNDLYFTPVSFETHYRSRDGKSEYKLFVRVKKSKDGKFKDLAYRFERLKPVREQPIEKQFVMPPDPLFFSFLPRYLAKIEPGMYVVKAILEDVRDAKLETRPLRIIRMAEKKTIAGRSCERSSIDLNGVTGDWWVSADGRLCEGGFPELKNTVSAVGAEEATKADPGKKF